MKTSLFVLVSASVFATAAPISAQQYAPPSPSYIAPYSGNNSDWRTRGDTWRDQRDWRDHRNDWRQSNPDDWRRSRSDWQDTGSARPRYSVGEEEAKEREQAKRRAYQEDDDARARIKDDENSADCNDANPWRGSASSAPCR